MMANEIVVFSAELAQQLLDSVEPFPVDFELAWVWLGYSRRDSAKRMLIRFKVGRDFHKVVENTGAREFQRFWLSVDCFKFLAMMAQTDQGDQVREYFLDCERKAKAASIATRNLTPAEMLLGMAQQLVEHERELIAAKQTIGLLQSQMHVLEVNQDETRLTAQRADSEVMRFRHHRMENGDWFSIKGWAALHKVKLGNTKTETQKTSSALGKAATAWCKNNDVTKDSTYDPDYGTVGIYPQQALIHAYAVVLGVITSELSA